MSADLMRRRGLMVTSLRNPSVRNLYLTCFSLHLPWKVPKCCFFIQNLRHFFFVCIVSPCCTPSFVP